MVSCQPINMKTNLVQMWNMGESRGVFPLKEINPDSILGYLTKEPRFSRFRYILSISGLESQFNVSDIDNVYTLFVPDDESLINIPESMFVNMDKGTARSIIQASTLHDRITGLLLKDSRSQYLPCINDQYRILVTNPHLYQTVINETNLIRQTDIPAGNGLIHVVSNIIWPYNKF